MKKTFQLLKILITNAVFHILRLIHQNHDSSLNINLASLITEKRNQFICLHKQLLQLFKIVA